MIKIRTHKSKIISIFFGILFLLIINGNNFRNGLITNDNNYKNNETNLKIAGYWVVSPFIIDGNTGWETINSTYDWCSGSGTYDGPYIIENVTIDGGNSDSCLLIQNSDVYFIIRNCTVYYSDSNFERSGLKLNNVNNGFLINNNCSLNSYGIHLRNSNNNSVLGNTVKNSTDYGIVMASSCNNTISGNVLEYNGYGIAMDSSCNNTISGNTANNNNWDAIILVSDNHNNTILGNIINISNTGIILLTDNNNNIVSGNTINNSTYSGIKLDTNINNIVSGNIMNSGGIDLYSSQENIASHTIDTTNLINNKPIYYYANKVGLKTNNFSNAGQIILENCHDSLISSVNITKVVKGIKLYFSNNNTIIGNTVSDNRNGIDLLYSNNNTLSGNVIRDNKNDGIYLIGGTECTQNLFFENFFFGNIVHATDDGFNNQWDIGTTGNYWDDYSGIDLDDDGVGDAPYIISGLAGSQDNFPIWDDGDDLPPKINIISPSSNQLFEFLAPDFNIEIISDTNLHFKWYTIDNGLNNFTFISNETINQALWDALPEGNVTIRFYANDSVGNIGFDEVTIRKDVTAPIIAINNPQNGVLMGAIAPNFDISIEELNLDKTWYSLNGGNNITFTGLTGTINQTLWDALPEGNVIIRFYANDTLGRIGFQEVTVVKDISQSSPPKISGYNILLLLGIVSTIAVIIVKKRLNLLN